MAFDSDLAALQRFLSTEDIERMFHSREYDTFFAKIADDNAAELMERGGYRTNGMQGKTEAYKAWCGRELLFGMDIPKDDKARVCLSNGSLEKEIRDWMIVRRTQC